MRLFALVSTAFFFAISAAATAIECADKPADPIGYQLTAIDGANVQVPKTTRPIAVLDTGVSEVSELQGRVGVGYDVTTGARTTTDNDGHGTAVAAIAAASGAVRGVSPSSPVLPIKIFSVSGNASADDFIAGIGRAVAADAGVINLSGAGSVADVNPADARAVKDAINAAVTLGIPVVAATGNEGTSSLGVPSAYPHVIAVGATAADGTPASFSNRGPGIDLVAPGENIVTSAPTSLCASGYQRVTGTSFAAPAVTGAIALLMAKYPELDVPQITDMLRLRGLRNPAPGWSLSMGFGILDVAAVLAAAIPAPDQPEVNDDIKWAKLQPVAFAAPKKSKTVFARIAPRIDPVDVYRVKLKKGDRLRVKLQQPSGTSLKLSFGASKLSAMRGSSFTQRITKSGTYFVGVAIGKTPPEGAGYGLSLRR